MGWTMQPWKITLIIIILAAAFIRVYTALDCDTIPDSEEAGDTDISTTPRDTDGDGIADFRDPDSDDDGLPDLWEDENSLNPHCTRERDEEGCEGEAVPASLGKSLGRSEC